MTGIAYGTLIVFALKGELYSVFQKIDLKARYSLSKRKHLYHAEWQDIPFYLLQTGVGSGAVRDALDALPSDMEISRIVNAGTCGSLRDDLSPGDIVVPEKVIAEWDHTIQKPGKTPSDIQTVKTCITVGCSQNTVEFRERLKNQFKADIVDMEAWAVMDWACRHGIPAYVLKCVSDQVGPQSSVELKQHLPDCSQTLAEALLS